MKSASDGVRSGASAEAARGAETLEQDALAGSFGEPCDARLFASAEGLRRISSVPEIPVAALAAIGAGFARASAVSVAPAYVDPPVASAPAARRAPTRRPRRARLGVGNALVAAGSIALGAAVAVVAARWEAPRRPAPRAPAAAQRAAHPGPARATRVTRVVVAPAAVSEASAAGEVARAPTPSTRRAPALEQAGRETRTESEGPASARAPNSEGARTAPPDFAAGVTPGATRGDDDDDARSPVAERAVDAPPSRPEAPAARTASDCVAACHGALACMAACSVEGSAPSAAAAPRADAPTPAEGDPSESDPAVPETPTRADVMSAVAAVRDAVRECAHGADAPAHITITFSRTGRVTTANTEAPYSGTPEGSCMARAVRRATVAPFARETFRVRAPFAMR